MDDSALTQRLSKSIPDFFNHYHYNEKMDNARNLVRLTRKGELNVERNLLKFEDYDFPQLVRDYLSRCINIQDHRAYAYVQWLRKNGRFACIDDASERYLAL